ncbi:MAG: hypothetical protein KU28_00155 [Sulfurovum sp. PC08-66]|nr:MAG: hypothetical protein KU28_00155 [Sulfurovum sp. PC08-66]KIM12385.1 MAG: hypothetical protein KU37_00275 [Sulfuricurvum sp. PC08-66]
MSAQAYADAIAQNAVAVKIDQPYYVQNDTPYITTQCYTKPKDAQGNIHNPCFSCHINNGSDAFKPNFFADDTLQLEYDFALPAFENRFTNLFLDRTELVGAISDVNITAYLRQDNYFDANGSITLAQTLTHNLPTSWDVDKNGKWEGYVPDCQFTFDAEGFDRTADGNYTGWRAFRYRPFLGTFWPTNGSTDDVLIKLGDDFMRDEAGKFNLTVYKVNLAIVESLTHFKDVTIDAVNEKSIGGIDIDGSGKLGIATKVAFKAPYGIGMRYVGKAKNYLQDNTLKKVARGLFPDGTQFLHSVRYIDADKNGTIAMAPRIKELRWAKKIAYQNYGQLENVAFNEIKERHFFPERTKTVQGDAERGLYNGLGWIYQGFIEDAQGELRPQNYEETAYCIGCHGNLGATTDTIFSFARKLDGNESWLHWSQKGLVGISDRNISIEGETEYVHYLKANGAGDEFRGNDEIKAKFFDANGSLNTKAEAIKADITQLIFPSYERAMQLNKAYKIIVDEQSFIKGRDAHVKPLDDTVFKRIESDETGIKTSISYK